MVGRSVGVSFRFGIFASLAVCSIITLTMAGHSSAQRSWQRGWGRNRDPRHGVPDWENDITYKQDVFTFCRIRFDSYQGSGWKTDHPDSDLNFSFRLQQLTSLKVDPDGVIIDLTDPKLFDYPFIYMCEPGGLSLSDDEADCLRRYLLNGGFLMCDDYWGYDQWDSFAATMKEVFPKRTPKELPLEHPIFHTVYDLKKKPQIPNVGDGINGRGRGPGGTNVSWEWRFEGTKEAHYKGLFDDNDRLMALFCHNTDLGDGWEQEGQNEWYFREYSEKQAYPMGINIVVYVMTH